MKKNIRIIAAAALMLLSISLQAARKPMVGISCGGGKDKSSVGFSYIQAITKAGGIPVLLPCTKDVDVIEEAMKKMDAVVFTGGEDYDPAIFGEERHPALGKVNGFRDTSDIAYARAAIRMKKPILGICRGEQLLNIVFGGTLYQDLPAQMNVHHRQTEPGEVPTHEIKVDRNSLLYSLMQSETLNVNTFHHQAVKAPGKGLRVIAMSTDGVVEAFQSEGKRPKILAVQFHPEKLVEANKSWEAIFKWLVKEAR